MQITLSAWVRISWILQTGRSNTCVTMVTKKQLYLQVGFIQGSLKLVLWWKDLCSSFCRIRIWPRSSVRISYSLLYQCSIRMGWSREITDAVFLAVTWTVNGHHRISIYMLRFFTRSKWYVTCSGSARFYCTVTCTATVGSKTHFSLDAVIKTTSKKVESRMLNWELFHYCAATKILFFRSPVVALE